MILYIAEKPSLGRAIASALANSPGVSEHRGDGFIKLSNGDCVSWCIGHLLEQAEPHVYNSEYKSWRMQHLPIVPEQWKLQPKKETKNQLSVLRKLVKAADELVHAGDPDREGQLLVDQLIDYLKVSAKKRSTIQRLLVSDLNMAAVKRALTQLQQNRNFAPLSASALARSRADWLYGINMTRAYTIQGRSVGYNGVLSVGRVQTPVLGLVARRCEEIEKFVSKPFFEVCAHIVTADDERFTATWRPSEACEPYMDDMRRVLVKKLAEKVVSSITDKPARITKFGKKNKKQAQPLPFSLSALQIEAARQFGSSAQNVLSTCQSLYERHKLITYPRSDCRYLPQGHYTQASSILDSIQSNKAELCELIAGADTTIKSPAWNDKKVTAHHAIIPTQRKVNASSLSKGEQQIYSLVARQYLAQFYPIHQYADTRVEIVIEGGLFVAAAKTILKQGWHLVFKTTKIKETEKHLPPLSMGQSLHCERGELLEKNTTPPPYFTDATLLAAMTGISRYVSSVDIRKILKDTDGLGTEATRAGIIELLFRRDFLVRIGKQIHATDAGRGLIKALPEEATLPDMTAHWEATLDGISRRETVYSQFMNPLQSQLHKLIENSSSGSMDSLRGVIAKKTGKKKNSKKQFKKTAPRRKTRAKKR
ncbi:DNA topoisomerase III [bacterium]|nr:DNA topoisomerase III [bacterium]